MLDSLISAYRAEFPLEGPAADYAECLEGGNAREGRRILVNNSNAQCLKCHNVQGYGGVAGPDLDNVANRLSAEKMLQSLIDPSADLAPGFGVVTLILQDEQVVSGILESETEGALVVSTSSGALVEVQKAEIEERINALSSMPAMGPILSKREVRDLMAYLQTMRGEVE
jgi:putative heme-binding domain-containing protein